MFCGKNPDFSVSCKTICFIVSLFRGHTFEIYFTFITMKITRWVSYFLLFSCVVLLTPRTFWHSCSHSHFLENKKSSKKQVVSFTSKEVACTFCDFELSLTEEPLSFHFSFQRFIFPVSTQYISYSHHYQFFFQNLRRGPPAIS
jgi:hypothetical protein